jgi:hypothetical protein
LKLQADTAADSARCEAVAKGIDGAFNIDAIDKRSRAWRRYQSIRSAVLTDLGGESNTGEIARQLISKFATLAIQLEEMEAFAVNGGKIDLDLFGRCAGHLRRIAETLGLKRIPRDVTPMLEQYLAQKREAQSNEAAA